MNEVVGAVGTLRDQGSGFFLLLGPNMTVATLYDHTRRLQGLDCQKAHGHFLARSLQRVGGIVQDGHFKVVKLLGLERLAGETDF